MKKIIERADVLDTISISIVLAIGSCVLLLQSYLMLDVCRKAAIIYFGLH